MRLLETALGEIVPKNQAIYRQILDYFDSLAKPQKSLGELEKLAASYGAMRHTKHLAIPRKAIVLMAGDHGVAKQGVSAYPQEVTVQLVQSYLIGRAAVNVLAQSAGAGLFIVDVGVNYDFKDHPKLLKRKVSYGTRDFTIGPAMTHQQAVQGLEAGIQTAWELANQGYELLALAEMGVGSTTASAAIACALCGLTPEQAVGRGSGAEGDRLKLKRQVVAQGLQANRPDPQDGLDVLSKVGGYDIAGLAGVILGGAARKVPVIVDGVAAAAAALVAAHIEPLSAQYLLGSHLSAEPVHHKMLEQLNLEPLLDLGLQLGEGAGAALGMPILDAAIKLYQEMATLEATLEEAGICP